MFIAMKDANLRRNAQWSKDRRGLTRKAAEAGPTKASDFSALRELGYYSWEEQFPHIL